MDAEALKSINSYAQALVQLKRMGIQSANAFLNEARVVVTPAELNGQYDLFLLDGPMFLHACGGIGDAVVKLIERWKYIGPDVLVRVRLPSSLCGSMLYMVVHHLHAAACIVPAERAPRQMTHCVANCCPTAGAG